MKYYLAPLEGITTYIYRRNYEQFYGGIDRYFAPFVSNKRLSRKELADLIPEHNEGVTLIPQVLTNRVEEFLSVTEELRSFGYDTVNLNLGCPSGTVVPKNRGAGFLRVPDDLDVFLSEIFEKCPMKISVKTRIGLTSLEEWPRLLEIYNKYPLEELIIHPRLQKEQYTGVPHVDHYRMAVETIRDIPLCYNGDIVSKASFHAVRSEVPSIDTVMIGRGLLATPALTGALKEKNPEPFVPDKEQLRAFHDSLYIDYQRKMTGGDLPVLFKMKEIWSFMHKSFETPEKPLKKIRKANRFRDYEAAVDAMFQLDMKAL